MSLDGEKDRHDYTAVEAAGNPLTASHFFIDTTSRLSAVSAIGMLAGFLLLHIYAVFQAPPVFEYRQEYFQLNNTDGNISIDIDITLADLHSLHRFVVVNCSLVAKAAGPERTLPIDITMDRIALTGYVDRAPTPALHFGAGCNRSDPFEVARVVVTGFDTLQLRLTVTANYSSMSGFDFRWIFANPILEKYRHSANLLLSILMAYMLIVFALCLRVDSDSFTQVFLLLLGLLGVLSSNPLNLFLSLDSTPRLADAVLMAMFIALYRMFLLVELELLRTRQTAPNTLLLILLGMFFCFYATVDAAALFDRRVQVAQAEAEWPIVLQTETVLIWVHAAYLPISVIYLIVAAIGNDFTSPRRLVFFGGSVLATGLVTGVTQVLFVVNQWFMYSLVPSMLFASVHVTFAAMTLFLMHLGGGPEYKNLYDEELRKSDANIALGIEQASDALEETGFSTT
jgi:hypothetical protein